MSKTRRFKIVDVTSDAPVIVITKDMIEPLGEDFGRNLDTIKKARQWLTNPHNWHEGETFVLKWEGLLCTICKKHGRRLIDEPWDDGLPEVVVREQIRLRRGGRVDKEGTQE